MIWDRFRGAGCTGEDPRTLFLGRAREFEREAGLADAGLTADENAAAASARGQAPGLEQLGEFGAPADERQLVRARMRGRRAKRLRIGFRSDGLAA